MKARREETRDERPGSLCTIHARCPFLLLHGVFTRGFHGLLSFSVNLTDVHKASSFSLSLSLSLSLFRGSLHYPLFYYRNSQLAGSFLRDVAQREGETGFSSGERERERERERVDQWDVTRLKAAHDGSEEGSEIGFSSLLRRLLRIAAPIYLRRRFVTEIQA